MALAISSIILMGVYRVVDGTANGQRLLEQRQEQMHLWIYLRRLLQRDLQQRLDLSDAAIILGTAASSPASRTSITLHCSGGVVPGRVLGPGVDVSYIWEENPDGEGMIWVREVRASGSGQMQQGLNMRVTEGLEAVTFSVLDSDSDSWKNLDEELKRPLRAVRWQFRWSMIGEWTLLRQLVF